MMMAVELDNTTQQVFEQIKQLSFLQTAQLVKAFEDEFGISAAAPAAAAVAAPVAAAEVVEEQSDFTIMLLDAGATKIQVLKEVRAITGLGLKEAKDLVDNTPKAVKEGVKKEEAEEIKKNLEELGAKIELK
jgi:large subunit ribosomal protein L7/L12